ncbi:hypothetical protein KKH43_06450 [Patescibacteria group bacterium]|nr:hypothetical protein [Patescibacteria group bacterium]
MKIYIGHSGEYDFKKELYEPIRLSVLNKKHGIVLPHEQSLEQFESKNFLEKECDVMIAEVSYPSTGLGIELGWADLFKCPIICIYQSGSKISNSLQVVCEKFVEYTDKDDMIKKLDSALSVLRD